MSRYRLLPTPEQELALLEHCRHARFVWNLAVEQHQHWRPGFCSAPGYVEQARQLTEARAEFAWLRAGSVTGQQQALRDFTQAMRNYFAGTHGRPTWRKAGRHEGFRQVAVKPEHVQRLGRNTGRVWVPKVGWVRMRWSRHVPDGVKSYRVTRDAAGRWHIAFAVVPDPIPAPGNGQVVGVDRGVVVSATLSTGDLLTVPPLRAGQRARETDRRRDWVEKIPAAYMSQACPVCGHTAAENRESQAVFRCRACGQTAHADVNAARNIAAGRAVTARGDLGAGRSVKREPQPATSAA